MEDEKKNDLLSIVGFELMDDEIKKQINISPGLKKDVEKWLSKYTQNGNIYGVKTCCVEVIPLNKTLEEFQDELGEDADDPVSEALEEYKKYRRKVRINEGQCPHYKTCPFFLNNMIIEGMKCPLELAESAKYVQGYFNELEIEPDNFTDMVVANQLVATTMIAERTLKALSIEPVVKEVKIINKDGSVRYDTKPNDNVTVFNQMMTLSEKLRKNLVLNREDRLKNKQLEQEKDARSIKNKLQEDLNNINKTIDVASIIQDVANDEDVFEIDG